MTTLFYFYILSHSTVNLEILARVLFRETFHENKILAKRQDHCHLLMKVNHVIVANFYGANMAFNVI